MDEKKLSDTGVIFVKFKIHNKSHLTYDVKEKLQKAIRNAGVPFEEVLEFSDISIHDEIIERNFHIKRETQKSKNK